MFYSHQLLARKAPLGQIWMAATLHAKINRRKLNKLNIIQICEEILNPSVPMALRLSGILMGGVVIVYQRKVKLLYDDLSQLLAEINRKAKSVPDPTVLPRGKLRAKKEAVTLPDYQEADIEVEDVERSLNYSDANATVDFQHTAYFAMRLDAVDEDLINENAREEGETENLHQADAANITLPEQFDLFQTHRGPFNHFERFDIEGDDDTQLNFASGKRSPIIVPSPPHHVEPPREAEEEIHDQYPDDDRANQPSEERKVDNQDKQRPRPTKRKTRKSSTFLMDHEQTIIPGHVYQSWLQKSSDIVSKEGRKKKQQGSVMSSMKIAKLMELPPLVLGDGLISETREIQYPAALMELWTRSNNPPPHDSLRGRNSPPLPPEPSSSSPRDIVGGFQDIPEFPVVGDIMQSRGASSRSFVASAENIRTTVQLPNNEMPAKLFAQGPPTVNFETNGFADAPSFSPGSYGVVSAASGFDSSRSNKKRRHSSSRRGSDELLETVAEEPIWSSKAEPNFGGLPKVSENGVSPPDQELLVETGPTQTQPPFATPVPNKLTETIHTQMKAHFDTPGTPRVESLNHLASGMTRKGAATLFYQTCVLATRDVLKVEQKVPYGDILISKGPKM